MEVTSNEKFARYLESGDLGRAIALASDDEVSAYVIKALGNPVRRSFFVNSHANREALITSSEGLDAYVDMRPVDYMPNPNVLFREINRQLPLGGHYVGSFSEAHQQTSQGRAVIRQFLGRLTKLGSGAAGKPARQYSLAEFLGRLVFCGFEIKSFRRSENLTYFVARKKGNPESTRDPEYNWIMRMKRVGRNGEPVFIYKIRTMYPYSEYVQDFVVRNNGYDDYGKPGKDFRLLGWGKLLRRIYIDEIPQLINFLKGDLNLVGLRPITEFALKTMPPEHQAERIKYKPGLLPPHIALRKRGYDAVLWAERKYLEDLKKSHFRTNVRYFFMAVFNIVTFRTKSA